jgi:hypothetical protein
MFTRTITLAATAIVALLLAAPAGAVERHADYGIPRAMPSDFAAAGKGIGRQYGAPRAMPSDYGSRRPDAVRGAYGMPRALPSDYARLAAVQGGSSASLEWSTVALGAASFLAALTLVLVAFVLRTMRRPPRPA